MRRLTPWLIVSLLLAAMLAAPPAQAGRPLAVTETPTPTATLSAGPTATAPAPPPVIVDPLITKRVSLERAVVGDRVDFTLTVSNPNEVAVLNVVVTDPLPPQVNFLSGATSAGALSYDAATHTVTVVIGSLAARQEVVITLAARVNANGQAPDQVTNVATLGFSNLVGQGFTSASNRVAVQLVPASLPATGFGPGPRERALLWGAGLLGGLAVLGLAGWRFARRR